MQVENGSEKLPSATKKGTKGFTPVVSGNPKGRPNSPLTKSALDEGAIV